MLLPIIISSLFVAEYYIPHFFHLTLSLIEDFIIYAIDEDYEQLIMTDAYFEYQLW